MDNLTQVEIIEQIDWERRENNAKFVDPAQTLSLMNRATRRLLREPGIRTVEGPAFTITAANGTTSYALPDDFKEVISIYSGEGTSSGIKFDYKPSDEYHAYDGGCIYTFLKRGFIDIKFLDTSTLPSSNIILRYWSKNIILDADGITPKAKWENDDDTSLLDSAFDEFFIAHPVSRILRREGKKEWKDREAEAFEIIAMLKEQPGAKTRRPRKQFGVMI